MRAKASSKICVLHWRKGDENGVLRVAIQNNYAEDATVTKVQLYGKHGSQDHAGEVFIEGDDGWSEPNLEATIPANTRVEASVLVKNPKSLGDAARLVLSGPSSILPASQWLDLQPPPEPEREKAIGINAIRGLVWLEGGDELDSTNLTGLGLWATYAFTERFHLEIEALGAVTGKARFEDGPVAQTRSARLGRVHGGLLVRLGSQGVMPYLRLGVGAQGASYEMNAGTGDDSSFEFDLTWGVGGGIQLRISDEIIAGATISAGQEFDGGSRSLQGGAHIGYSWMP